MDIYGILNIILAIVFVGVGVALIVFVVELIRTVKTVRTTVSDVKGQIDPTLDNVQVITDGIKPVVAKVDPLMDRVQLTVDTVNLEMMRVDGILENVSEITQTASSATAAVDNIANAPLKAVNSMVSKVRTALGEKDASEESEQLAQQRVAVGQALQDYKKEEKFEAKQESLKDDERSYEKKLQAKGYITATEGYAEAQEQAKAQPDQAQE